MFVLRTTRKKVPLYEGTDKEKLLEIYYARVNKYDSSKFEIYDCIKGAVVNVKNIERRHSSERATDVRESVSKDSDRTLYATLGDRVEPTTDSPD